MREPRASNASKRIERGDGNVGRQKSTATLAHMRKPFAMENLLDACLRKHLQPPVPLRLRGNNPNLAPAPAPIVFPAAAKTPSGNRTG